MAGDPPLLVLRRAVELANDTRGEPQPLRDWRGTKAYDCERSVMKSRALV